MRGSRSLHLLVAANGVSLTGNVAGSVAIPWFVLTTTGSVALTGMAAFASTAPMVAGSLLAGRIVDRLGARRTSIATDLLSGASICLIPLLHGLGKLEFWHLLALVFAGSVFDSAGAAARASLVPHLAAAARVPLERANSRFGGMEHAGYLLGAPIAGLLMAVLGPTNVLWIDAASFAVSAGLLALVSVPEPGRAAATEPARPRGTLRSAVSAIRRDPVLRVLVVVPAIGAVLIDSLAPVILPVYARDVGGAAIWLGAAVAAYGIGGLAGIVASPALLPRTGRRRLYVAVFLAWPALYGLLASLPPIVPALGIVFGIGLLAGLIAPIETSVVQERSPPELLPRIIGVNTAVFRVAGPASMLAVALSIDRLGLSPTLWLLTAGTVALAGYVVLEPAVRQLDPGR